MTTIDGLDERALNVTGQSSVSGRQLPRRWVGVDGHADSAEHEQGAAEHEGHARLTPRGRGERDAGDHRNDPAGHEEQRATSSGHGKISGCPRRN